MPDNTAKICINTKFYKNNIQNPHIKIHAPPDNSIILKEIFFLLKNNPR